MNSLSWLIYFADVIPNIGGVFIFFSIMVGILAVVGTIPSIVCYFCEGDEDYRGIWVLTSRVAIPMMLFFSITAALIPTRQTILLIAASEMGEQVATSKPVTELGGKAYDVLNNFLDEQLKKQKVDE